MVRAPLFVPLTGIDYRMSSRGSSVCSEDLLCDNQSTHSQGRQRQTGGPASVVSSATPPTSDRSIEQGTPPTSPSATGMATAHTIKVAATTKPSLLNSCMVQ
ncbi:hypothetical protein C8Q77DRAFT_608271 [Trametes polyzona]|nr:hypothetical protein C8Q77DRAFT_608271 [Trametes polyzona]